MGIALASSPAVHTPQDALPPVHDPKSSIADQNWSRGCLIPLPKLLILSASPSSTFHFSLPDVLSTVTNKLLYPSHWWQGDSQLSFPRVPEKMQTGAQSFHTRTCDIMDIFSFVLRIQSKDGSKESGQPSPPSTVLPFYSAVCAYLDCHIQNVDDLTAEETLTCVHLAGTITKVLYLWNILEKKRDAMLHYFGRILVADSAEWQVSVILIFLPLHTS